MGDSWVGDTSVDAFPGHGKKEENKQSITVKALRNAVAIIV
jgi:hypothetical protein